MDNCSLYTKIDKNTTVSDVNNEIELKCLKCIEGKLISEDIKLCLSTHEYVKNCE